MWNIHSPSTKCRSWTNILWQLEKGNKYHSFMMMSASLNGMNNAKRYEMEQMFKNFISTQNLLDLVHWTCNSKESETEVKNTYL